MNVCVESVFVWWWSRMYIVTVQRVIVLLIKKPYGLGEEAVFKSGGPCSDAPIASPRRQQS